MKIILGVSASIAIYKSCELTRNLTKNGIDVVAAMTHTAAQWISPLLFHALTGNQVYLANSSQDSAMGHIEIRRGVDLMLIAPATAHIIAKLAHGLADDIITTTALSYNGPKWIAPSMNPYMYANSAVQKNLEILRQLGFRILSPQNGEAVCGDIGEGKMMNIEEIEKLVVDFINTEKI